LKERLRQINPAFVWENVDKYPNLEARTVTVDTAISRLKNIGGVKFTDNDEKNLRSLRTTRNAIEHYEWSTTRSLIEELSDFVRAHGARIEANLRAKGEHPSYCDACEQLTVPTWGGSCELCGHWQDVDDGATDC
jgi:hypothetical protein